MYRIDYIYPGAQNRTKLEKNKLSFINNRAFSISLKPKNRNQMST